MSRQASPSWVVSRRLPPPKVDGPRPRPQPANRPRPRRRGRAPLVLVLAVVALVWLVHARTSAPQPRTAPAPAPALAGRPPGANAAAPARPAGLTPNACQLQPPAGPDRHTIVFVDPGHGGVDPGALGATSSGATVKEKDVTLAVGLRLMRKLQADGYSVLMSRTTDTAVAALGAGDTDQDGLTAAGEHRDTLARVQCANTGKAQLLLAMHLNSFDYPSVGGAETIYDSVRPFAGDNQRFAALVQRHLLDSFAAHGWTVPDRDIKDDGDLGAPGLTAAADNYGHLLELGPSQPGWLDDPSHMPGVLTEPLFVTDRVEADIAVSQDGQEAMAAGLEKAIQAFLSGASAR